MIEPTNVTSIEGIISEIKKDYASWETTTFPWFRGEPATPADKVRPLLPKLYRVNPDKQHENYLLQHFRMKAPSLGLMDTPPREHTDEWLFLAQHVGLPKRLLDWTEGLMVALYFASKEEDPVIWMLDPVELNRKSSNVEIKDNEFPLTWFSPDIAQITWLEFQELITLLNSQFKEPIEKINEVKHVYRFTQNIGNINIRGAWELDAIGTDLPVAIHPTNIHSRMHAQKSCFTVHGKKKEGLSELVDNRVLRKYVFKHDHVNSLRNDLKLIGFTHTAVLPDLDNLAKELSETF